MYNRIDITGMNAFVLSRSSSASQGTSISNQGRTVDSVIKERRLHVLKEYVLEAVTGSVPGNRSDIDDVIEQRERLGLKQVLLLVPDHTRFTRAGVGHGGHLLYRLRTNGILVYFVAEDLLVQCDLTLQLALMLLAAAHQTAKSIARSATIGTDASFLSGRSPHCRRPPFALDRMYFVDGVPLHIIRNLPDGTQQMLHPVTREFIRAFGQNAKRGVPAHYIKQKNETVSLCAGDPQDVAKLFLLFEMRYVRYLGFRRIALMLNEQKVTSPMGLEWSAASIQQILLNPIYLGMGLRYRNTRSIYVKGGSTTGEPEPSELTPEELQKSAKIKTRRRDRSKWKERPSPQFNEFLPEQVREAARAATNAYLDGTADGPLRPKNRDPHIQSLYFLKNLLTCKTTGLPMTGRLGGRKGKQKRQYAISKGAHIPRANSNLSKRVYAEPIDRAVLELIQAVVRDRPRIEEAMNAALARSKQQHAVANPTIADLEKQIRRLRKQIALLSDSVDDADENDPIVKKVALAKTQLAQLTASLRQVTSKSPPVDPAVNLTQLADELETFGRMLHPTDMPLVTAIANLLISRLTVDRQTGEFELELAIPSWFAAAVREPLPAGLQSLIACKPQQEATPENQVKLGTFACDGSGRPLCYACRRREAAA